MKVINNATPYAYTGQQYACDLTGCSYYFDGSDILENSVRAILRGSSVILFKLKEQRGNVDVFITIPDNFIPTHYFRGIGKAEERTKEAHLSYHGSKKKKKMSGEIHLINNGAQRYAGEPNKVAAPLAYSKDIEKYPLPICRIELNYKASNCQPKKYIPNFFELNYGEVFFNTVEVYLARVGFLKSLVTCSPVINNILGSIFIYTSLSTFYLNKIERRAGRYPQALALQTKNYELVILALQEYKNPNYLENSIRYFHTEDFFNKLIQRNCLPHAGGYFLDVISNEPKKKGFASVLRLIN